MVKTCVRDGLTKGRIRNACRQRCSRRRKARRRAWGLVWRGDVGARKGVNRSITETEMCFMARERSCGSISACGGSFTAANYTPLCPGTELGKKTGEKSCDAVSLREKREFFVRGECSLARGSCELCERERARAGWGGLGYREGRLNGCTLERSKKKRSCAEPNMRWTGSEMQLYSVFLQ